MATKYWVFLSLLITTCNAAGTPFLEPSNCQLTSEYFNTVSMMCERCTDKQMATGDSLSCICPPTFRVNGSAFDIPRCEQCPNQQVPSSYNFCIACPTGITIGPDMRCECLPSEIAVEVEENGFPKAMKKCVKCETGFVPNERRDKCVSCLSPSLSIELIASCMDIWTSVCTVGLGVPTAPAFCPRIDDMGQAEVVSTSLAVGTSANRINSAYFLESHRLLISYTQCNRQRKSSACNLVLNMCSLRGSSADMTQTDRICSPLPDINAQKMIITDSEVETKLPPINFVTDRSRDSQSSSDTAYSYLDLRAAVFNLNGTFDGWKNVTEGILQLCRNKKFSDAWLGFGVNYAMKCQISARDLWTKFGTKYYQLYIVYPEIDDMSVNQFGAPRKILKKFIVPVKMTSPFGSENSRWLARFFMVDNRSLKRAQRENVRQDVRPLGTGAETVRYASNVRLRIRVNGTDGILPPQLLITYRDVDVKDADSDVDIEFSVSYEGSGATFDDVVKMLLISLIAVLFYVGIKLYGWFQRRGGDCDQGACLLPTIMLLVAGGGNILTIIALAISIWYLIAYKFQNYAVFMLPAKDEGEKAFVIVAVAACVCKLLHCLQIVFQQSTIDIFFLDWEQPKLSQVVSLATTGAPTTPSGASTPAPRGSVIRNQPRSSAAAEQNKPPVREHLHPVSVWRTLFVCNEWNELQVLRRTNPEIQFFVIMTLIEFAGLGNLATGDPYVDTSLSPQFYHSEFRRVLRFGITGSMYIIFAIAQWLFFMFIYERWVEDAARNFVDLCALSNISVFILAEQRHGYYVHGRLLHGHADTNQKELSDFLKSEAKDESPKGGLFGTAQRTFEIMVPLRIRSAIDTYLLQIRQASGSKQRSARGAPGHNSTDYTNLTAAQETIKYFISNEVEKNGNNVIRTKKTFMEHLFDIECIRSPDGMIFYEDDGRAFENVLLLGHELTLVVFELLIFCVIDMFTCSVSIAGLVTYIISKLLIVVRGNFGEKNVALKTGVDERFLI